MIVLTLLAGARPCRLRPPRHGRAPVHRRRACCSRSPAMPGRAIRASPAPQGGARPPAAARQRVRQDPRGHARPLRPGVRLAHHRRRLPARAATREGAAELLQNAVRRSPDNADLWVGYGNALVMHGGGMMSPAAQLAFQRAAALAPDHPAPRFFYGLALAQGGQLRRGRADLARARRQRRRPTPPIRRIVEERLRRSLRRGPRVGPGSRRAAR